MPEQPPEANLDGPSPEALLALRLIPKWGDALAQYAVERHQRRVARATQVLDIASQEAGVSPEELVERIAESEQLSDLLNDALQSAVRTGMEKKRRALGKVLAQAVAGDDAKIDEAAMTAAAIGHIEPIHVRLMAHMFVELRDQLVAHELSPDHIRMKAKVDRDAADAALLQMQAWGLVRGEVDIHRVLKSMEQNRRIPSWDYDPKYQLTGLGLEVVILLEAEPLADETPPDAT